MDTVAWARSARGFLACHQAPGNVELHLVTTPVGLFGAAWAMASVAPGAGAVAGVAYALLLAVRVPWPLGGVSAAVGFGIGAAAELAPTSWPGGLAAIAAAWLGQELAHRVSGERTYQSTYEGTPSFWERFVEHTLLLLPLVIEAGASGPLPFLHRLVPGRGVTVTRLGGEPATRSMARIRAWVEASGPAPDRTTHVWRRDLPDGVREDFDRLATDPQLYALVRAHHGPGWVVEAVHDMNEVYVTGPEKDATSDTVFYLPHIDGPWVVWPGAAVYRCMLALSPNRRITTHFPLSGSPSSPDGLAIDEGEVAAFDFNRTLHFITCDPQAPQTGPRINLKLHVVAWRRGLRPWGRLLAWVTARYDEQARDLFLFAIDPKTPAQRVAAAYVVATTKAFAALQRWVGAGNLAALAAMAAVAAIAGSPALLVLGVSFIHYAAYVAVFRERGDVGFGRFVRDATFWKSVSTVAFAACWLTSVGRPEPMSLAWIAIGGGLAASAAWALGAERTYFGVELGLAPPQRIARFPYGVVPHPMIVGSTIAIVGAWLAPGFRAAWPWLAPAHLALYAIVLTQEVGDERRPARRAPLGRSA